MERGDRLLLLAAGLLLLGVLPSYARGDEDSCGGGEVLVFSALIDGAWALHLWHPKAAACTPRLLATNADVTSASLSATREKVAWEESSGHVWVGTLDHEQHAWAKEATCLSTRDELGRFIAPSLSPDGAYLLTSRRVDRARDDTDLCLWQLSEEDDPLELGPAWRLERDAQPRRWVLPMVSSQFMPEWGSDQRRLAWIHLQSRWSGRVIAEVWEGRVDHSFTRQVTLADGLCEDPAWSPDGDAVAFVAERGGVFDLYVVDVASGELKQWTADRSLEQSPRWAPNGQSLLVLKNLSSVPELVRIDQPGGGELPVRPFGTAVPISDFDWR